MDRTYDKWRNRPIDSDFGHRLYDDRRNYLKLFRGNDKAAPKDEQDKAEKQETEEKALPKITSGDSSTEL